MDIPKPVSLMHTAHWQFLPDESAAVFMSQKNENFPNGIEAVLLLLALFYAEYAASDILQGMGSTYLVDSHNSIVCVAMLGNALIFSVLLSYKRMGYAELFHSGGRPVVRAVAPLLLPILSLVPALTLSANAIEAALCAAFPMSAAEHQVFAEMQCGDLPMGTPLCLVGPILEEMLFRGIILRSFLTQYPRFLAILGSAFLFGAAHLNIYQFPAAMIAGVVIGWIYERTRSLWPGIVLHAGYNAAVVYLSAYLGASSAYVQSKGYWALMFVMAAAGTACLQWMLVRPKTSE